MKKMFEIYSETMLSPLEVLGKAKNRVIKSAHTAVYTKKNFSKIIDEIGEEAYKVFLEEQEKAGKRAMMSYFRELVPSSSSLEVTLQTMAGKFEELDRFFLSLAQSRKSRAGSTYEWMIKDLFKTLKYPFAEQQIINGAPDFLMPSREHYDKNPMDCIIFTVKTTLRERWRQIVTEGTRGLGFFLATIDKKVSESQLAEMLKNRIYLVVSSDLKSQVSHYQKAVNVISFEQFFRNHLDPAVKRWERAGVKRR